MANEIRVSLQLTAQKGNDVVKFQPGQVSVDQNGSGSTEPELSIGTAEEDVVFTDIAVPGYLCMRNLDDTNFVEWGPKDAGAMILMGVLKPGEVAVFRVASSTPPTLRMKADTAACRVQFVMLED